jgi:predicted nucleotidyltransferase
MSVDTEKSTIPNMSQSIKEIVSSKKKILFGIKPEIDIAIEFFSSIITTSDIDIMIKALMATGYMHLFKIMSTLELAIIREENQSNKIMYEEALQNLIPIPVYTGNLHDIIKTHNANTMTLLFDLAKIKSNKDADMESTYTRHHMKAIFDSDLVRNNCLTNHINLTILSIVKTSEILKKV